ncbi:helix-turn-helix transcriptional regulator [Halosolutus gelatinilyticus]|uniref:helix-turn-helix transcriptional regulator n=1 Tax=Halosolutus gelatinilyticus TaxID=2931975 RepID=UPI001FF52349|nr:ArsR family transcriptional regulator [Halosolutus gelatinilyticus]
MSDDQDLGIGYLSGSPVRVAILDELTDGPAKPADLVSATDVSRTTVHRSLTELGDRGWIDRVDGGYAATTIGELALETYRRARTRFRTIERFEPFLAHVDVDAAELEVDWLETAELVTASETRPHQPVEWYADRVAVAAEEGAEFRGVSPVVNRQLVQIHTPIIEGGTQTSLVIDEATCRAAAEQYAPQFRESIALDHYELYVTEKPLSTGLSLAGETVFLGAYDSNGRLVVVLESTDDRLRTWTASRFRRLRENARLVTADLIDSMS